MAGRASRFAPARVRAAARWNNQAGTGAAALDAAAVLAVSPAHRGRLALALVLAALVGGLALLAHTRGFLLGPLYLAGLRQVTPAEINADLALPPGTYAWQVRPWTAERHLLEDPLIGSARVAVAWPHGLSIDISERLPAALLLTGDVAWEVDGQGRLLRALQDPGGGTSIAAPGLAPHVPVIAGVVLDAPAAGAVVHQWALGQALAVAGSLGGASGTAVREVTISPGGSIGAVTSAGIAVDYGDGTLAATKTAILLGILACIGQQGLHVSAIDVSAPLTPALTSSPGGPPLAGCAGQAMPGA